MIQTISLTGIQKTLVNWQKIAFFCKFTLGAIVQGHLTNQQLAPVPADGHLVYRPVKVINDISGITTMIGITAIFPPTQITVINVTALISQLTVSFTNIIRPRFFFSIRHVWYVLCSMLSPHWAHHVSADRLQQGSYRPLPIERY